MKKKWTIIFLIYSELSASRRNERELFEKSNLTISSDDDSVRKELKSLFNDILSTPISKDVSVLVIYNRILLNSQETDQDVTFLLEVRESATPLNTIEFGIIDRCVVDDVTLKARSMTLVFYKIYKMYDSDRRLLFTWDHGSIFGIFRETVGYSITQNISYHKPWNKFQPQKNIGDILTSDELADAIQSGFNGKKIDILIMMNCYMQNIHTQYSLQKSVELLIAPESIISMPGYDYRAILSGIINNPDIYPGEVVKSVILSLKILSQIELHKINMSRWVISVCDLSQIDGLVSLLDDFIRIVFKKASYNENFKKEMIDIRARAFQFDYDVSNSMIDINNLIYTVTKRMAEKDFIEIKSNFDKLYDRIIVDKFVGKNVYVTRLGQRFFNHPPGGSSIYFPRLKEEILRTVTYSDFVHNLSTRRSSYFKNSEWFYLLFKLFFKDTLPMVDFCSLNGNFDFQKKNIPILIPEKNFGFAF